MLIRDDMGRKMDSDTTSVVQVYRAHVDAASRILNDSVRFEFYAMRYDSFFRFNIGNTS